MTERVAIIAARFHVDAALNIVGIATEPGNSQVGQRRAVIATGLAG